MLGRIFPFLSEPAFRSRHGVIFDTVGSLLSLLRTGAQDAYRQFFMDSMLVVEDLLCVASVCADISNITESTKMTLKCFSESFNAIFDDPAHLGDLPESIKPVDGTGILINVTGNTRWQPCATWMIKFLGKCLTEGTLYVEGLMNVSFVMAAWSLLCYGDADLHMACFDFASIAGSAIKYDVIPYQNIMQSISTILSEDKEGPPAFRDTVYDSSMGGCLEALHSNCPEDIVKLTAAHLVNVLPHSMRRTRSQELKVALCNTYIWIAKMCPPHIWRPQSLPYVLSCPDPCFSLIDCLQVALSILGPDLVGGRITNNSCQSLSTLSDKSIENSKVGEKRPIQDADSFKNKRQKIDEEIMNPDFNIQVACLSMLCIAFCRYPETSMSLCIFHQMYAWIPWICQQAKQGSAVELDISIDLEGIHCMLLLQSPLIMKFMENMVVDADLIHVLLKLPWIHSYVDRHHLWKT